MSTPEHVPLSGYREYPVEEMRERAARFYEFMKGRRTVRTFSDRPVPREIIERCIRVAGTAPSGANRQPWTFVAVSDPEVKREIRKASEERERAFYRGQGTEKWVKDLEPLGTDAHKPFLEIAPYLIIVFSQRYGVLPDGGRQQHYYVSESVGIATGMLIAAVHRAGLVSLTYTPNSMGFLTGILKRPPNEKPFLILVVGYPAEGATVPRLDKKPLHEIARFV